MQPPEMLQQAETDVVLRGHKLFVTQQDDRVRVEAVTDERPLTRMVFHFSRAEAVSLAADLSDASTD